MFVDALRCWQCIAHDCDLDPEDNYKASKVECRPGSNQCMVMAISNKIMSPSLNYPQHVWYMT